jgi:hypothetical protein
MAHTNAFGLICGLQFSAFIFQYYGLMLNLLNFSLQPTCEMAGPLQMLNNFLQYCDLVLETHHLFDCTLATLTDSTFSSDFQQTTSATGSGIAT